jgi:hypothetical protein
VNALNHLGPRVRLADASLPSERDTGAAASAYTLSDEDKRAIAAVLQEQRKGLEFLRNTLMTDVRHVSLMLEQMGGGAVVSYARGATAQSLLPQGANNAGPLGPEGPITGDQFSGASVIDPMQGGGSMGMAYGAPVGMPQGAPQMAGQFGGMGASMMGGGMGMGSMMGMGGGMYGAGAAMGGMGGMGMQAASPFAQASGMGFAGARQGF